MPVRLGTGARSHFGAGSGCSLGGCSIRLCSQPTQPPEVLLGLLDLAASARQAAGAVR